ncbi:relaxosome protein TraM [Escherichia coli]|uniref:relaxosome protein TraM n=1 Tax=Escherichia coli TaxID=562 RepID=UPI003989FBFE
MNAIIEKRRQEGAREKMSVFQATASMLLELVFVYMRLRWSAKSHAFNQAEFNKLLLECVCKNTVISSENFGY